MKLNAKQKSDLKKMGDLCQAMRKLQEKTIEQVAKDLKTSTKEVENFERGLSNNALFLMYYLGTELD